MCIKIYLISGLLLKKGGCSDLADPKGILCYSTLLAFIFQILRWIPHRFSCEYPCSAAYMSIVDARKDFIVPPVHSQRLFRPNVLEDTNTVVRRCMYWRHYLPWLIRSKHQVVSDTLNVQYSSHPIGIIARSKAPKRAPISLKTGHTGASSSSASLLTALYPVSPPKNTFTGGRDVEGRSLSKASSTDQLAQSDLNWSVKTTLRPVMCWQGVQVMSTTLVSESESLTVSLFESHQSMM